MQLESLFQRYLRECNYVERLDALDIDLELEFHEIKPHAYTYSEIPHVHPDEVVQLVQKRINGTMSCLEQAQLQKHHFHAVILVAGPEVTSTLWTLFIQPRGEEEFSNLS